MKAVLTLQNGRKGTDLLQVHHTDVVEASFVAARITNANCDLGALFVEPHASDPLVACWSVEGEFVREFLALLEDVAIERGYAFLAVEEQLILKPLAA